MSEYYKKRSVLVTGGAGFVGSNLIHRLVRQEALVTVVDNFHPDYGGNEYNLERVKDQIRLVRGDVTDRDLMRELVGQADIVFHIAAQCSHVDSMIDPWLDIDYNCRGTLSVLEAVRQSPKRPVVVYAGTRAMIGAPLQLPATESTLPNPTDIYGVNKLAAELYGSVFARVHQVPFVSLRLTNCFGPYHQMKSGKYGILNWFISLALQDKPVKVFGTGEQLRDYLYIDDAVEAFLKAGEFASKMGSGQAQSTRAQLAGTKIPFAVFNISSGKGIRFVDCAKKVVAKAGSLLEMVPWPPERASIETGDFVADCQAANEALNWKPSVEFGEGLDRTFEFYRENLNHYL
ncbi:MAG: NAD-dependent epimerase/dehydratase family protein [Bdellovibrionota bacterium]